MLAKPTTRTPALAPTRKTPAPAPAPAPPLTPADSTS
eukprot:gene5282-8847_t